MNWVDPWGLEGENCPIKNNDEESNKKDDINSIWDRIGKTLGLDKLLLSLGTSVIGDKTAQEMISKYKKGSINSEFPSEYKDKTINQILEDAKSGNPAARTAKKLLFDKRFNK